MPQSGQLATGGHIIASVSKSLRSLKGERTTTKKRQQKGYLFLYIRIFSYTQP